MFKNKTIRDVIIQLENNEDSSFNLINRINSDIIAKLRYGFSVVTWKITMLNEIDKEIRKSIKRSKHICKTNHTMEIIFTKIKDGLWTK